LRLLADIAKWKVPLSEVLLNTAQPAAAKHAPPRQREETEEAAGEESLPHHARRLVGSRLSAMVSAVLDPVIALLQRWRKGKNGADNADAEDEADKPRSKKATPGRGRDAAARAEQSEDQAETEAPKPRGRLRAFLIYFSLLLAGGMAGGALAYELLAKLLERQAAESQRLEAAMAKLSKSTASNSKKLEEAQTKRVEAEKNLEEAKKKQTEAEKKLEAALTDTKAGAEKQKKLDDAVKLLEQIRGPVRPGAAQGSAEGKPRPPKSGNCNLASGNIGALKDCVDNFNR
jgi:hypothetical protein